MSTSLPASMTLLTLPLLAPAALALGAPGGEPDSALPAAPGFELRLDEDHVHAGGLDGSRPDAHAPIGVMGDHRHHAGEWMLSVRYMRMSMDGNRDGTSRLSPADVRAQGFMVAPTEMTMEMLMFGAMYAPTDRVTLMAMVPWVRKEMDHETGMLSTFTTEAEGLGDVGLGALIGLWEGDRQSLHANAGLSLPTGATDERDATPMGPNQKLPYPMQLGSGTFDLKPGLTWLAQRGDWSFGAQGTYTLRLGENDEDYTLGDQLDLTTWGARRWSDGVSTSLRLAYSDWDDIDGADPDLNPAVVPTARPDLRGGQRLDLALGVNVFGAGGALGGNRLALELAFPLQQDLDGPQLETDWTATLGWQLAF